MTITRTDGAKALLRLLSEKGLTQSGVAGRVGARQQTVSEWARGLCRPSHVIRLKLEAAYGIPAAAWFTEKEASEIQALATEASR